MCHLSRDALIYVSNYETGSLNTHKFDRVEENRKGM